MVNSYYIESVHRVQTTTTTTITTTTTSVRRCFTKQMLLTVLQNSQETPVLESHFNKSAGLKRVHHKCFPMKCFFLISPQNQTTLQRKQISKVTYRR